MENAEEDKKQTRKCASAEKREYLKTMLRLKHQENIFEMELKTFVHNLKIDSAVTQDLLRNLEEVSTTRQKEFASSMKIMQEINDDLTLIRSTLDKDIRKLDVNEYKQKLVKLSQRIQSFKNSMPIRTLSEEGMTLESDLNEFLVSIQKYNVLKGNTIPNTDVSPQQKENKKTCNDNNEIHDFHALVAKTGHTQNWSDEDHLLFVKLRKKCNNIPALIMAIQSKCPDLTTEAIVNHEAWYKTYLDLREKQRNAVKEWRMQKESGKLTEIEENGKNYDKLPDEQSTIIIAQKMTHLKKEKNSGKDNKDIDMKVQRKKELIREWKTEKENKRNMDDEQVKLQIQLKQAKEEKRRNVKLIKIQEALDDYRRRKLNTKKTSEKINRCSKASCKYDRMLVNAFRKQDEEYLRRKVNLISQKKNQSQKSKLPSPKAINMPRDSTLLNSTKVWNEKCKIDDSKKKECNPVNYEKDISQRYCPPSCLENL